MAATQFGSVYELSDERSPSHQKSRCSFSVEGSRRSLFPTTRQKTTIEILSLWERTAQLAEALYYCVFPPALDSTTGSIINGCGGLSPTRVLPGHFPGQAAHAHLCPSSNLKWLNTPRVHFPFQRVETLGRIKGPASDIFPASTDYRTEVRSTYHSSRRLSCPTLIYSATALSTRLELASNTSSSLNNAAKRESHRLW